RHGRSATATAGSPGGDVRAADPPGRGSLGPLLAAGPARGRRLRRHERDRPSAGRRAGQGRHRIRPVHPGHLPRPPPPPAPPVVEIEPGVRVLHLPAGPLEPIPKQHLPRYLCAFLCSLLRAGERPGPYDVLHSHYWVSGWVARLARERWDSPVAHSFHTLGQVKNLSLADGDQPEPPARLAGEERVGAPRDRPLV